MEASYEGGQGPEGAVAPWMVGWNSGDNAYASSADDVCVCQAMAYTGRYLSDSHKYAPAFCHKELLFLPYGRSIGSCICLTADLYVSHVFVYVPVIFFAGKSV